MFISGRRSTVPVRGDGKYTTAKPEERLVADRVTLDNVAKTLALPNPTSR